MLVRKSPQQIKEFLARNLHRMDMPELWCGDEPNTYGPWGQGKFCKDFDYFFNPDNDRDVARFCYMTCWDLVQTAGNQTVPLLYQLCNDRDGRILAERGAFPPTRKDIKIFNDAGIPPFSLESKHVIFTDFDVIGTTLAFPGFYPNLLKQFRDAGVPPRWEDRDASEELFPLVFLGGQLFAQPGPVEPIVDVIVVGEGEDGLSGSDGDTVGFPTLLLDVIEAKRTGQWFTKEGRLELLHGWSRDHQWCYVPRFYKYNFRDPRTTKKHFISYTKLFEDIPDRPKRRWIKDLDSVPCTTAPIINAHDPSMGLGEIEASRSCTGSCSFCAEVYRYRPYRERSVEYLVKVFAENIKNSGATNAFPTGFDFPCFSRKHELYYRLGTEVCSDVDTQSSRVDHFIGSDAAWAKVAGQLGMRQLAVGVEGNSERLRQIMSKGATKAQILQACQYAFENKFDKIKFFMIADWAWETEEDTKEIIDLGREIVEMKKAYGSNCTVRFSWTPLLIEAWTPLQWGRAVISASDRIKCGWTEAINDKKLAGVYDNLKPLGIGFTLGKKTELNYYYFMQAFHMCDRLLAECFIKTAEELDQVYCGAVDRKFIETMAKHMEAAGLTWDHYFRSKDYDEDFWWDLVDIGVPKPWVLQYAKKMQAMIEATNPAKHGNKVPDHDQLVQIGTQQDKSLRLRKDLLDKGMLVATCDTACAACMACEENGSGKVDFYRDVMKPEYFVKNKEADEKFKDILFLPKDDTSYTHKLQGRLWVDDGYRYMPNPFWVACIRRAAYMAELPISKMSIRLASSVHGDIKPWVAGTDYFELGVRNVSDKDLGARLNEFAPRGLRFDGTKLVHRDADILTRGVTYDALFHYVLNEDVVSAIGKIHKLHSASEFEMSMKKDEYRKGVTTVKLNVKDWVRDTWLIKQGHELILAMLMRYGEPTPYNVISAVFGLNVSDTHETPCRLIDLYLPTKDQVDFFTPTCVECGAVIPINVFAEPFDADYCFRCKSAVRRELIAI